MLHGEQSSLNDDWKSIDILDTQQRGFFLMVEAGRIEPMVTMQASAYNAAKRIPITRLMRLNNSPLKWLIMMIP